MSKKFDSTDSTSMPEAPVNFSYTGERNKGIDSRFIAVFSAVASGMLVMANRDFSVGGALGTAIGAALVGCAVDKSTNPFTAIEIGGAIGTLGAVAGSKTQERISTTSEKIQLPRATTHFGTSELEKWI